MYAMSVTIYHNPRCSKSRQTLELIQNRGIEPEIIRYLDNPPSTDELEQIIAALGIGPRELLRRGEDKYRELGLDSSALGDQELIAAMCTHPILIERPIVLAGKRARIGRPPEAVEAILP